MVGNGSRFTAWLLEEEAQQVQVELLSPKDKIIASELVYLNRIQWKETLKVGPETIELHIQ
jgi:hypothetical protein